MSQAVGLFLILVYDTGIEDEERFEGICKLTALVGH
jgi:hypothetical protein